MAQLPQTFTAQPIAAPTAQQQAAFQATQQLPPPLPGNPVTRNKSFAEAMAAPTVGPVPVGLLSMYDSNQQHTIQSLYNDHFGKPSEYMGGEVVDTLDKLLVHAKLRADAIIGEIERKRAGIVDTPDDADKVARKQAREANKADKAAKAAAYEAYYQACRERKIAIAEAKEAWRLAVKQRNEALAQWDAFVAGKRDIVHKLTAYPVPLPNLIPVTHVA